MGQNFALNMASHGFSVCVGNRSYNKVETTVQRAADEGNLPLVGSASAAELCAKLSKPRKIVILVQAGKPVDMTIAALAEHLEAGDLIIDGGNEWFPEQVRRSEELAKKGILFMGMGISGGEEGARNGPSLMPGGTKEAYAMVEDILKKCAAKAGDPPVPCTGYCGPIGAGNYVKMYVILRKPKIIQQQNHSRHAPSFCYKGSTTVSSMETCSSLERFMTLLNSLLA